MNLPLAIVADSLASSSLKALAESLLAMYQGTALPDRDSQACCTFSGKYDDDVEETEYVDGIWWRAAARDEDDDLKKGIVVVVVVVEWYF